jgi:predicted nucleic acid-binding protein
MTVLGESSVWIDFLNGVQSPEVREFERLMVRRELIIGDLIVHEVLRGVRHDAQATRLQRDFSQMFVRPLVTPRLALISAGHYRYLRARGITIRSTIDCLIATYCIETGTELLHSDRDFDPFEAHLGLKVRRQE